MKPEIPPFTMSIVVPPKWAHAASLRTVIATLVKATAEDAEAATNAGMVACELAENAIKYGDWSRGRGFDFRLAIERGVAVVEVSSPYDPSSGSYVRLQNILRTIRECSAKEAYLQRLAEVAEKADEIGRLGLLRIAHELGSQITAGLENGNLRVRAEWALVTGTLPTSPPTT